METRSVPSSRDPEGAPKLRTLLLTLMRFRTPEETGVAFTDTQSGGIARPNLVAQVTVRRKDGMAYYTRFYRFFTDGTAVVEDSSTRTESPIEGGWQYGVVALLKDAENAFKDHLEGLVSQMTEIEHSIRALDQRSR